MPNELGFLGVRFAPIRMSCKVPRWISPQDHLRVSARSWWRTVRRRVIPARNSGTWSGPRGGFDLQLRSLFSFFLQPCNADPRSEIRPAELWECACEVVRVRQLWNSAVLAIASPFMACSSIRRKPQSVLFRCHPGYRKVAAGCAFSSSRLARYSWQRPCVIVFGI